MEGVIFKVSQPDHFNKLMIVSDDKFVIIDYNATWCGPCKKIAPIYAELAKNNPGVVFATMDTDKLPQVTEGERVTSLPTFILYHNRQEIDRVEGASTTQLKALVNKCSVSYTK